MLAAVEDEVSQAVAALFSARAQTYQAVSAQAGAFHAQFMQALIAGADSYAITEAANASPLQQLLNAINAPSQALTGRPLIGDGAAGRWTSRIALTRNRPGRPPIEIEGMGRDSTRHGWAVLGAVRRSRCRPIGHAGSGYRILRS
ncbi:PE family protein [Mycobacterium simiae]|uniref:PE family protein n=1 Tax=Mycobacterium simiae TaxID=1784 RepID=A0A5B1BE72_MYCSI|nr:PE family protein [Mycobacterium simiae]